MIRILMSTVLWSLMIPIAGANPPLCNACRSQANLGQGASLCVYRLDLLEESIRLRLS